MTRTALIDGDILIYEAASRVEQVFDWGQDLWSIAADFKEAKGHYLSKVNACEKAVSADDHIVVVSDPMGTFRGDIYHDYKGNRKTRKPLVFKALREWAIRKGAVTWPKLEGDDVLGIMATMGVVSDPVVITIDKDLHCVPGQHYNPNHPDKGVITVTQEEADRFHLVQTMAGDATDNIKGIPGVGLKTAKKHLDKDGYTWSTVLKYYEKAELTEEDALLNARLTKILTADLWDPVEKLVKLWEPEVEVGCG